MRFLVVMAAALAAACSALTSDERPKYSNPVLDHDFPDPAVLRAPDGAFYAYATQSSLGERLLNIQVARSRNLVQWEIVGDALPQKPRWAQKRQGFWAPHVIYDEPQRKYFMYYTQLQDEGPGKCMGVAVAQSPAGPFVDSGTPLACGRGDEYIDPMAFDDPKTGRRLLYWGGGARPIQVRELAADRLGFAPGSAATDLVFPDPSKAYRARLVEGAWLTYRDDVYYLFYSGDTCCGLNPRYAVMVARAASPFGPFEHYAGGTDSAIVQASGFWNAPGHNAVIRDDSGTDWMLYHAYDAARTHFVDRPRLNRPGARVLLLDRIVYRDGWPRVDGDQPSAAKRPAPVLR